MRYKLSEIKAFHRFISYLFFVSEKMIFKDVDGILFDEVTKCRFAKTISVIRLAKTVSGIRFAKTVSFMTDFINVSLAYSVTEARLVYQDPVKQRLFIPSSALTLVSSSADIAV